MIDELLDYESSLPPPPPDPLLSLSLSLFRPTLITGCLPLPFPPIPCRRIYAHVRMSTHINMHCASKDARTAVRRHAHTPTLTTHAHAHMRAGEHCACLTQSFQDMRRSCLPLAKPEIPLHAMTVWLLGAMQKLVPQPRLQHHTSNDATNAKMPPLPELVCNSDHQLPTATAAMSFVPHHFLTMLHSAWPAWAGNMTTHSIDSSSLQQHLA